MRNSLKFFLIIFVLTLLLPSTVVFAEKAPIDVLVRVNGDLNIKNHTGNAAEIKAILQKEAVNTQRDLIDFLNGMKNKKANIEFRSHWIINAIQVTAPAEIIRLLNDRPDVKAIIPNEILNLPVILPSEERPIKGDAHWNIAIVNAPDVWKNFGLRGEGIRIGHLDSGANGNHPDLAGKIYAWKDFVESSTTPDDGNGHGTHTLGTILGGNHSGAYIGMAPMATAAVAKIFGSGGSTTTAAILSAMEWIMDPDGDPSTDDVPVLVSNSWGSSAHSKDYWEAVDAWIQAGIFPCFAAGNSGPSAGTVGTPGGLPHAFAVGATDSGDKIASFSSRGPITWDGVEIIKPDVSAPGKDIKSALKDGGWGTKSGTSMACPNVAGAIALLYQAEPSISIDSIRKILEETAVELGVEGKDNTFGSGRMNILKAVENVLLGGKLSGTITNEQGVPLVAQITLSSGISVKTDQTGHFSLLLKEGEYEMSISAFAYQTIKKSVKIVKKQTVDATTSLRKSATASLTGIVVERTTNSALSATVSVVGVPVKPVQTDPKTGKFVMALPAGDYTVKISSFQHQTLQVKVELTVSGNNIEVAMDKLPPVLLVADSKTDYTNFYADALKNAEMEYTFVTSATEVTADTLIQYPVVIWFTGKDSSNTLTDNDQVYLTAYLKSGGNLLLSGQDIGYNIKNTDFYREMLKAKYLQDSSKVKTVVGQTAPYLGLNMSISGGSGANNQSYPDVVEAIAPAKEAFRYDDGTTDAGAAGVLYKNRVYTALYISFGFEGIADAAIRTDFIKKALGLLLPSDKEQIQRAVSIDQIVAEERENSSERARIYTERLLNTIETELNENNTKMLNVFMDEFEANSDNRAYQFLSVKLRSILMGKDSEKFETELLRLNELMK